MDDASKFSQLSPNEIAAGSTVAIRGPADGEHVSPIPAHAPLPPTQHFNHGEPTATWIYRDANGAELCRILRFDFPDRPKEFCPLTLWRKANRLRWRWKPFPRRAHCTALTDLRPVLTRP